MLQNLYLKLTRKDAQNDVLKGKRIKVKFIFYILNLLLLPCSNSYADIYQQENSKTRTEDWFVLSSTEDKYGKITYYASDNMQENGFTRKLASGRTFSYRSTLNGAFIGTGELNSQTLIKQQHNVSTSRLSVDDRISSAINLDKAITRYIPNPVATASSTRLEVEDNTVSIAMVLDSNAVSKVMERGEIHGLSLDESMQAAIDITNLALLSSNITEFSVTLGEVVILPEWDSATLDSFQYGETIISELSVAMMEGNADRVAFVADPAFFPGLFLGFAKQWYFKDDDENLGIVNSSFNDRVMRISAGALMLDTVAHEFGHTLGLGHERNIEADPKDYALPYGYTTPTQYKTLMSYGSECTPYCDGFITAYSTPRIKQGEYALGISGDEKDAADAALFIQRTWPMTTQAAYQLLDINISHYSTSTRLSWTPPKGLAAQQLYISNGSTCPDVPSPYKTYTIEQEIEEYYDVVSLAGTTSSFTIANPQFDACVILVGQANHQGASIQRTLGMSYTGENGFDKRFNLSSNKVQSTKGTQLLHISTANSSTENAQFVLQAPTISQYSGYIDKGNIYAYKSIHETEIGKAIDYSIDGTGSSRQLSVNLDPVKLSEVIYHYGSHGTAMTNRLPLRLVVLSSFGGVAASQPIYIDLQQAVEQLPNIALNKYGLAFKDENPQDIRATFSNVDSISDITVTRYINDNAYPVDHSELTINQLRSGTFEVAMAVAPPAPENTEYLMLSTATSPLSKRVELVNVTWPFVNEADISESIPSSLPTQQPITFSVAVQNPNISEGVSISLDINCPESPSLSGIDYGAFYQEFLPSGALFIARSFSVNDAQDCAISVFRYDENKGFGRTIFESSTISFTENAAKRKGTKSDFNGDGAAELVIVQKGYVITKSSVGGKVMRYSIDDSAENVVPLLGDFSNNQLSSVAYYNTLSGIFTFWSDYYNDWRTLATIPDPNNTPLIGDFTGDGYDDFALRNQSNGIWTITNLQNYERTSTVFGNQPSDIPVVADYDGDGIDDLAVRRVATKTFIIKESSTGKIKRIYFGSQLEDIPVVADYDGDGKADLAVRRPSRKQWYIKYSSNGKIYRTGFGGQSSDIPISADYDGDGKADIAVRRPSTGYQFIYNSSDKSVDRIYFGSDPNAVPLTISADIYNKLTSENSVTEGNPTFGPELFLEAIEVNDAMH